MDNRMEINQLIFIHMFIILYNYLMTVTHVGSHAFNSQNKNKKMSCKINYTK